MTLSSRHRTQTTVPRGMGLVAKTPNPTSGEMKRSSVSGWIIGGILGLQAGMAPSCAAQPRAEPSSRQHLVRRKARACIDARTNGGAFGACKWLVKKTSRRKGPGRRLGTVTPELAAAGSSHISTPRAFGGGSSRGCEGSRRQKGSRRDAYLGAGRGGSETGRRETGGVAGNSGRALGSTLLRAAKTNNSLLIQLCLKASCSWRPASKK